MKKSKIIKRIDDYFDNTDDDKIIKSLEKDGVEFIEDNTMTAKEFIKKEALEYSLAEYDEGGFLGIDERLLEQKLEEYHQAKLKLLSSPDNAGQSEELFNFGKHLQKWSNTTLNDKQLKEEVEYYLKTK